MRKTRTLLLALSLGLGMNAYAEGTTGYTDPSFQTDDVVAFSTDGGEHWSYYTARPQQDPYVFEAVGETEGILVFNPDKTGKIEIVNDFQLKGANFEIKTSEGQTVSFTQPLSNYTTAVTLTGKGTIETEGAAAFGKITVGNGEAGDAPTLKIDSQIGVINGISVAKGGNLNLENGSTLLLTKQIANEGTVNIANGAVIDASNVDRKLAEDLGIMLLNNLDPNGDKVGPLEGEGAVPNGYLYGSANLAPIQIATGGGTVRSDSGTLRIGVVDWTIDPDGDVYNEETQYSMWLQNAGEETLSLISTRRNDQGHGTEPLNVMLRGGSTDNPTTVDVDFAFGGGHQIYVSRNTVANINLIDGIDPERWEPLMGGVGELKVLDGAKLSITTLVEIFENQPPDEGRINRATFVGQNIELTSVALEGVEPPSHNFSPLALTVESASSVLMKADIQPAYGYFEGTPMSQTGAVDVGDYLVKGVLTMASGFTMDMTTAPREASNKAEFVRNVTVGGTTKAVYSEEFAHLKIEENAAIVLQAGAVFKANTVKDGALLDNNNLDTTRTGNPLGTSTKILPDDVKVGYELNGTVVVNGLGDTANAPTSITAEDGAGHYTTRNCGFTISNADITVSDAYQIREYNDGVSTSVDALGEGDTTISNVLIGDSVTNDKRNHGKVTLDNGKNENFDTLYANQGDIAITNNASVNAQTVHLGAGREVSVSSVDSLSRDGSLTVTELLQAEGNKTAGYSKIGANLNLAVGVTLDVAAANGAGGINMQEHNVTFGKDWTSEDALTLSKGDYDQLWALEPESKYDLFFNVTAFDYGYGGAVTEPLTPDSKLDASMFFTNLEEGCFYLCYTGTGEGGAGGNVGTIYLYSMVPEPTTGTLSLLALAGLAARRRRK